ncbi:MAG: ABC transporter ATP-binding protein [Rhodospirillaceae bacterium]|nr:ABC transporter ATP-binding protein [Rhodospirillaceae bacterium]
MRGPMRALRDVSMTVPRGGMVGIVGESGCGKSTLMNAILGLMPANGRIAGGRILFDGRDLVGLDAATMRRLRGDRLSVVFQDPMTALNPVHTIGAQMVDIQYRLTGSRAAKRARAAAMLAKVRMPDPRHHLDQYAHEFSGGMRQRICIAMALMAEPDLLICDEPTTALDATLEVQMLDLLRDLQREIGCAVIFISHHLGLIAELCAQVVVMYAGQVVERGSVRDIFHRPAHPYTRRLLDCDPARIRERAEVLPTIPGDVPDLVELPPGCIFSPRCPVAEGRCHTTVPPDVAVADGHHARCLLARPGEGAA